MDTRWDLDGAVSSSKCNELMMMLEEVEGLRHGQFGGALPVEALARLAQAGDQLSAQYSSQHGVKRGVDGFVADLQGRFVRVHPSQYACDLLR